MINIAKWDFNVKGNKKQSKPLILTKHQRAEIVNDYHEENELLNDCPGEFKGKGVTLSLSYQMK